ncbi:hypothetical protein L7F22_021148 [Adiantum nelumboides]|nr:hypothetical protein [Adiantum nelumboides]
MTMDPDFSSLATRALKLINDVRRTALEIAVNRADFLMMAYYLVELRPFLEELNKQQEFLSAKLALPSLQHFTHVIESIHTFTKVCASRSRIYLLCHSIDLVQNMNKFIKELAESLSAVFDEIREVSSSCERLACEVHARLESLSFQPNPGHNRLSKEIRTLANTDRDESIDIDEQQRYCTILLQKIASHLNVHFSEASTMQLELQKDLSVAESEGREDDIYELKKLCAVLCSPEAAVDRRVLSISERSSPCGVHAWEVPSSFFCPITKDIMREPVMVEQGHTYEKVAILEWFQRGYRNCPDTGKELKTLELIPNVTLQEAMDEYFTKMHTQQLLNSLHELKKESTSAGIEAGINVIKSILRKNPGYIRLLVPLGGLGPLISVLKLSPPQTREWILRILYKIALLGDSYKLSIVEENAIPTFIRILSKNPGDKGGPLQLLWELSKCEAASNAILSERGAVLIVASACNLCQNDQRVLADKLLNNLCLFDKSIIVEAAKSSVFGPLISGLTSGNRDENFEGSSSHGTERVSQAKDAVFKAQLISFMETFGVVKAPKDAGALIGLSPIVEKIEEAAVDETLFEAEDDGKSSYRTMDEANPLQQLLEQLEKARLQERRLRKQELLELVAAIKAPHTFSSITATQPLVRNSPNFTKYDEIQGSARRQSIRKGKLPIRTPRQRANETVRLIHTEEVEEDSDPDPVGADEATYAMVIEPEFDDEGNVVADGDMLFSVSSSSSSEDEFH